MKLKRAKSKLLSIREKTTEIRINNLLQRTSAMKLINKQKEPKTVINIQKIERTLKMWKIINLLHQVQKIIPYKRLSFPPITH